jgi:hypothetical protein
MFIAEIFTGTQQHKPEEETTFFEDSGPQLVVLYPGRFQPFHLGHRDVFAALQGKFGRDNVFISTSNKTELPKSPFNFSDKLVFMTAAGVPVDRVIEQTSPYKLPPQFDPESTILVVAVGAPDADRLRPGSYKKDGQPGYYQPFVSADKCETADKHGYVIVAAERKKTITIGGKQYDVSHGTESRNLWNTIRTNPKQRAEYIAQMFGRNDGDVGHVLDKITEAFGEVALPVDSISPIHGGINESAEDAFAPSERVFNQVQQDRHPLKDYLTFEDYDMLMDEFADAQSAVKNDAELDAYIEKFESGLESAAIPQVILEIVEEFVHGRHGKYGTEVPRRNQVLLDDLNAAFSQIWMDFKPDRFVRTLVRHMSLACVAAIHAEESDDDLYEEDDDMFAPSKAQKVSQGLRKFAEELQGEMNAAHASWQQDKSWYGVEQEKIKFIQFLADNFNNRSKVPYTLNYIARVLNGDSSVVEYYKKHAIWDADDYLKETMGHGFAELFDEYAGQLDEEDDMFADSKRVKVTKAIIDDLEYIADQMMYEPEAFLEGRGWEDADVSIDEVQEAGSMFENLANEFKTKGLEGGLAQLFHIFHHTQNQVAEWVTDETIDALSNDYEVDMSRFNLEEEDDMFSAPGKVATSVKHNVSRKLAVVNQANRAKDQELQKIVEIAKSVYGRPYSTGTIGGGKVYRLSIPARLNHDYRYVKLDSVSVDDKTILNRAKGKFFDLLKQQGLDASRVDIKYHIGSGLYVSVRIKMKSEVA